MDDPKAGIDRALRRIEFREQLTEEQRLASDKYVAGREEKRQYIPDIPKHGRYEGDRGPLFYAGTRTVDGVKMLLLRHDREILVHPVDDRSAVQAARYAIGDVIAITDKGQVQGRDREIRRPRR